VPDTAAYNTAYQTVEREDIL